VSHEVRGAVFEGISAAPTPDALEPVTHVGRGAPWEELMRTALALSRETG
jgi:hypothetical protein